MQRGTYKWTSSADRQCAGAEDSSNGDFPGEFWTYVKEKLHCQHREHSGGALTWIFWNREDDHCKGPPVRCSPSITNQEIIEKIKSFLGEIVSLSGQVLVQFWTALEIGGRRLLTTRDQPFGLTTTHEGLCSYRLTSLEYEIYVDGGDEEGLGLPGRVFRHQWLESTPDVRYYSCKEYPQRHLSVASCIRGSWALPIFEPSEWCCVGVLELVTVETGSFFASVAFKFYICKTLEGAGLKCLETCSTMFYQHGNKDDALKDELVEINVVLEVVCEAHCLPSAQIWVPCRGCNAVIVGRSFNGRHTEKLVSKIDMSSFIKGGKFPFRETVASYHLQEGQGVVGRAYSSHNLVFCEDIAQFSIIEYPLAHYAREYGLAGCFAICLQSTRTTDVYVLEFFLPSSNAMGGDTRTTLVSILTTLRQHFQSFKVASGEDLGGKLSIEVINFSRDIKVDTIKIPPCGRSLDRPKDSIGEIGYLESSDQHLMEMNATLIERTADGPLEESNMRIASQQKGMSSSSKGQQRKAGIPISLVDLEQHFGMKLEEAAESLGVSRSTLKRACREFGIYRWPSHKRNKDNHSLSDEFVPNAAQEQIQESDQPPVLSLPQPIEQVVDAAGRTKPHPIALQDTSNVTIKAKYGDLFIKFRFSVSLGMSEFQQQVAKRLGIKSGTYFVKYLDEDNDLIVIACDEDMKDYICKSRLQGMSTVTLSLHPITRSPP